MKKVLLLIVAALMITAALGLAGCKKNDQLIMVTEAGFAPYEYYAGNEIVGVDVDIAKEIAAAMGKELVIKDIAFDSLIAEVKSGKADFAAAGMSISEEKLKEVDFSIEYATSRQVVIVKSGQDKIKVPEDISGKKAGVQLGTVADLVIGEDYGPLDVVQYDKYLAAAEDLKAGRIDCIVMDSLPAEMLVKANPGLEIIDGELFTDVYGIAVRKGNTQLLNKINEVLQRLIDEGKVDEYTIKHTSN